MDYYNIDSILAHEEKIKVKFPHQIRNFGFYINPTLSAIRSGTHVDVPYFLVDFLLRNEHCVLVDSRVDRLKDDLDAEAGIVDLSDTHFFMLDRNYADCSYLVNIFYERVGAGAKLIVKEDFSEGDLTVMSHCEKKLFIESRRCFKMFQDFFFRKH